MTELTEYNQFSSSPTAVILPTKILYIYCLDKFLYLDPKFVWSDWIIVCCEQGVLNLRTNKEGELIDVRDKVWQLIKNKLEGILRIIIVTSWVNLFVHF